MKTARKPDGLLLFLSPLGMELFPLLSLYPAGARRDAAFGCFYMLNEGDGKRPFAAGVTGTGKTRSAVTADRIVSSVTGNGFTVSAAVLAGLGGAAGDEEIGSVNIVSDSLQWDLSMAPFAAKQGLYPDGSGVERTGESLSRTIAEKLSARGCRTFRGTAYTGDSFAEGERPPGVASPGNIDMETAAVLSVLNMRGIPCAAVRLISDDAFGNRAGNIRAFIDRDMKPVWEGILEGALTFSGCNGIVS